MFTSNRHTKRPAQGGFSLVEAAIVLLIVGLTIGGILRGQELIASSRARNITEQSRAIQVAYYAFQDRYNALPGDLTDKQALLISPKAAAALDVPGDGWVPINDSQQFFNNLAQGGFISCAPCMTPQTTGTGGYPTAASSPVNIFGQPIGFTFPSGVPTTNAPETYYLSTQANEGTKAMVSTGSGVDSKLLAEIDRKIDDGYPASAQFRYSDVVANLAGTILKAPNTPFNNCVVANAVTGFVWKVSPPGQCQGILLL